MIATARRHEALLPPAIMNLGPLLLPPELRRAHWRHLAASIAYGATPIYDQLAAAHAAALATYPGTCSVRTCTGTPGKPCTMPGPDGPLIRDTHRLRARGAHRA